MKTKILTAITLLVLTACSTTIEGSKVDYKSQGASAPSLEIPPDLTQLTKSERAIVPASGAANASSYGGANTPSVAAVGAGATVAASSLGAVRVQREGSQRWLVVENQSPDKLWDQIKAFWLANGLTLVVDQPSLGILETEWSENRAKLPQQGIGKYLGKVLGGLMSTNERDKYRTRLERTVNGGTEIYITHRGMVEDFADSTKSVLQWKPRPQDPELEIEFLKRLMVQLGAPTEITKAAFETVVAAPSAITVRARLVTENGQTTLLLGDTFDQAWRRVGFSLDRNNFTVEDRDRSKGIYFVRYVDPEAEKNAPGFFARLFGAKAKEGLNKYQVWIKAEGNVSRLQVLNTEGKFATNEDATNILKVLVNDLK